MGKIKFKNWSIAHSLQDEKEIVGKKIVKITGEDSFGLTEILLEDNSHMIFVKTLNGSIDFMYDK